MSWHYFSARLFSFAAILESIIIVLSPNSIILRCLVLLRTFVFLIFLPFFFEAIFSYSACYFSSSLISSYPGLLVSVALYCLWIDLFYSSTSLKILCNSLSLSLFSRYLSTFSFTLSTNFIAFSISFGSLVLKSCGLKK